MQTEKPAQKEKKKPASAPQKPIKADNTSANEKTTKKDEKPATANTQKAQEGGKSENKPEGMILRLVEFSSHFNFKIHDSFFSFAGVARAPRGRGGRVGGPVAGGAGIANEQQPPASAPLQREPPPPPKYDQPRPEGAGAPRGRGGRGFGFGGRGRFPRSGGPRLAFAEGVPSDTNAASGAASGGQEGGAAGSGEDSFVNRGFDTYASNRNLTSIILTCLVAASMFALRFLLGERVIPGAASAAAVAAASAAYAAVVGSVALWLTSAHLKFLAVRLWPASENSSVTRAPTSRTCICFD